MADSAYGAPQASTGGGIGGYFADHPWAKWVALGGVAALAYYLYKRRQGNAQNVAGLDTTATTSGTPSYIDPTTGMPYGYGGVNMGQVGSPSTNIDDWITNAMKFLTAQGVDPIQAENALARWISGQSLTTSQQNIVGKALQGLGQPPGGAYPVTPVVTPPPAAAQGTFLNPVTWVWNVVAPATVAAGTGLLTNLGWLGQNKIRTPPIGAALYARVKNAKGQWVWTRISTLNQWVHLAKGTQIAYLTGSGTATQAA